MTTIYFNGQECHTYGNLPSVGQILPPFDLAGAGLSAVKSSDFAGKRIVLNIFPSLDTEVCARSVRKFNEEASSLPDTVVICVSMDLPFAMTRFCTLNDLKDVIPASAFRAPEFSEEYGVRIVDGPLAGLLARAVVVADKDGKVIYREMVEEITHEPDYAAALSVLR